MTTLTVIRCFVEEPHDAPHVMEFVGEDINQCLKVCNVSGLVGDKDTVITYHSHKTLTEEEFNQIGESKR